MPAILVAEGELALDTDGASRCAREGNSLTSAPTSRCSRPTISTTGLAKVISGLYRIPAIHVDFDCVFTNTVPVDAIRGAGKPEALSCSNGWSISQRRKPAARRWTFAD